MGNQVRFLAQTIRRGVKSDEVRSSDLRQTCPACRQPLLGRRRSRCPQSHIKSLVPAISALPQCSRGSGVAQVTLTAPFSAARPTCNLRYSRTATALWESRNRRDTS